MLVLLKDLKLLTPSNPEFQRVETLLDSLSNILQILQPDLSALNNQGYNSGDQLMAWTDQLPTVLKQQAQEKILGLVSQYRSPLGAHISFRRDLSSQEREFSQWLR
jgi:hypothetical protein